MRHKHAEVLHAIAEGKDVEWQSLADGSWSSVHPEARVNPIIDKHLNWRVKPEPEAEWKQKLRQAAREGKRIEYLDHKGEWVDCLINSVNPDAWDFFGSIENDYRIVPKTVTRWLWAYKYAGWTIYSHFLTESEAALQFRAGEYRKIESSAQEFEE